MNKETSKNFFMILSLLIPAIFGIIIPWPDILSFPTWSCFIGLGTLCIAFSPQKIRDTLFLPIFKISHFIGIINQYVLMGIIFYLIFTPLGLVRRILKVDGLKLKKSNNPTFWRKPDESKINFDRPY